VLVALLSDCLQEAPKDAADRINQAMYDVMGDICITVQCLDMVETPLISLPPTEVQTSPLMERFRQAQKLSTEAASMSNTNKYQDHVYPMAKLKQKPALDALWAKIDQVYKNVTGVPIDDLFELGKERVPRGQWSFTGTVAPAKKVAQDSKKLLSDSAHQRNDDSDSDMPALVTDSDSSDLIENNYSSSESEDEYDDESVLDTDDEDNMRELYRECKDATSANPELLNEKGELPSQYKSNRLMKALKNLAGRVFSGDPVVTADGKPRAKFFGPEKPTTMPAGKQPPSGASTTRKTAPQGPAGMKATVEEVPDEEAGGTQKKKKKKKPKKKKKKTSATAAEADDDDDEEDEGKQPEDQEVEAALGDLSLGAKGAKDQGAKSPAKPKPKPAASQSTSIYGMGTSLPSSVSLVSTTAQSARSYLKAEGLLEEKTKAKSRPDPSAASEFKSPLKLFGGRDKDKDKDKDKSDEKTKDNVFSRLVSNAKYSTQSCFSKMFGHQKGSMRWDDFVKSMVDIGFTYEGSTAGSSVKFDPPDSKDPSITVHKPHPKAILQPHQIKAIAKRLKGRYNWRPELFMAED